MHTTPLSGDPISYDIVVWPVRYGYVVKYQIRYCCSELYFMNFKTFYNKNTIRKTSITSRFLFADLRFYIPLPPLVAMPAEEDEITLVVEGCDRSPLQVGNREG